MTQKVYLGDIVYAEYDGHYAIVLTTENGKPGDPSNLIVMEPEVIQAFQDFVARLCQKTK